MEGAVAHAAATFSGVVHVSIRGVPVHAVAHGLADRRHHIDNTIETRFGVASVAKGFTALVAMALAERGTLSLATTARSLLGADLVEIDDGVTVEHLLGHRSGIGDYLDEAAGGDIADYVMEVPVHRLDSPEAYLAVLDGHPTVSPPGDRFAYCNSGYAVLAILTERASGTSFYELVDELVCRPAGLTATAFDRSDELAGDTAVGYLDDAGLRTNVLHLPVRGTGDGGIHTTASDLDRLWRALFSDCIVRPDTRAAIVRPRGATPGGGRYGLGFWLDPADGTVALEGYDAGVSCRTTHHPERGLTVTVMSNTSEGAWPVARALRDGLGRARRP